MDKLLQWLSDLGVMKLLKSKRFWIAVFGLAAVFGLELSADELEAILLVISMLVGGYSVQDAVAAARK